VTPPDDEREAARRIPAANARCGTLHLGVGSTLSVAGAFANESATLELVIGGRDAATEFGTLSATGAATLTGSFSAALANGFTPRLGDSFRVLSAGAVIGQFSTANLPTLGGGLRFQLDYSATGITLTVVPEPAAGFVALSLAAAAIERRRRRR